MLHSALRGEPLVRVLSPRSNVLGDEPLSPMLAALLDADPTVAPEPLPQPALAALSMARWVLATSGGFRQGALRIANMGADSDVIGAVHGQLAGAFYGLAAIPGAWLRTLARAGQIERFAGRLYEAGAHP
jgi:ADP-ribosyl-[dinitrogen reductase] hydrolase